MQIFGLSVVEFVIISVLILGLLSFMLYLELLRRANKTSNRDTIAEATKEPPKRGKRGEKESPIISLGRTLVEEKEGEPK